MARTANATRQQTLETLARVGREHSDATVLFHARVASFLDLHSTDYKTLGVLERLGPMSAGDIARHTGLASASVTNLIDRLERKGFARRTGDDQFVGTRRFSSSLQFRTISISCVLSAPVRAVDAGATLRNLWPSRVTS